MIVPSPPPKLEDLQARFVYISFGTHCAPLPLLPEKEK
jgi:hypothetical protein